MPGDDTFGRARVANSRVIAFETRELSLHFQMSELVDFIVF